jgi:hypothetical protein
MRRPVDRREHARNVTGKHPVLIDVTAGSGARGRGVSSQQLREIRPEVALDFTCEDFLD